MNDSQNKVLNKFVGWGQSLFEKGYHHMIEFFLQVREPLEELEVQMIKRSQISRGNIAFQS